MNELFIILAIIAQISMPLPVGKTHHKIKPVYVLPSKDIMKPIKPKVPDYCPPQEGDYQCPMENSNLPEKEIQDVDNDSIPFYWPSLYRGSVRFQISETVRDR